MKPELLRYVRIAPRKARQVLDEIRERAWTRPWLFFAIP